MFSNWTTKSKLKIGDRIIKLREERQLFARFLVIQQSRPEMVPKIRSYKYEYELSVIPRLQLMDLYLSVKTNRILSQSLKSLQLTQSLVNDTEVDRFEPNIPSECQELSTDNHEDIRPDSISNRVIIIDAMAILQGMKKHLV